MTGKTYTRKVSSEEVREGHILILKNWLGYFPPLHQKFLLTSGNTVRRVAIESYPCTCVGPDKPHEHYFIRWPGLKKGICIQIDMDSKSPGRYVLKES
ncbi:MAG: hypothetical protein AB1597_05435 [Chloroflexota bacterium]